MDQEKESTRDLWRQYFATREGEFRDELIVKNLFLVKYVVGKIGSILPTHVKLDDLYSSGVTGLVRAVERFNPAKNSKFESYAILLIKGSIIDELRELDWIPRSIHQKTHLISAAQDALQQKLGREPTDKELADYLKITEEELAELLLRIRPAVLISLNGEAVQNNDEEHAPFAERIADVKAETSYEVADRKECAHLIEKAIAKLPEQERKVLVFYYYEELMLKEIGKIMGISESRVSQIHTKALLKLKGLLQTIAKEYIPIA